MSQLRARDVRDRCKGRVDPAVQYCLEALAEQQHQLNKGLGEIALLVNQMADMMPSFMMIAENMKKAVEAHRIPDDDVGAVS